MMTAMIKSLAVATLLATTALMPSVASAQEAITLEAIGAVRMAQPSDRETPRSQPQTTPASVDYARSELHADSQ